MSLRSVSFLLQFIRQFSAANLGDVADEQLLVRFADGHDQNAFATILLRHGPMVLHVCRQILRNTTDVEDAFQATFLVFVRRIRSIQRPERLAGWLYGVAYRVATRVRIRIARQRSREQVVAELEECALNCPSAASDHWYLVHEEVNRLPEKFRQPIVLCYFQGMSREEAARQLGWTEGAIKGSLERGRDLLRSRLLRHGPLLAGFLPAVARGAELRTLPAPLCTSTVDAAVRVASATAPLVDGVSQSALLLTDEVLRTMLPTKRILTTAFLVLLGLVIPEAWIYSHQPTPPGVGLAAGLTLFHSPGCNTSHDVPVTDPKQSAAAPDPQPQPGHLLYAAAYSRDGKWLALAQPKTYDGKGEHKILLFDTSTWRQVQKVTGPTDYCFSVTFSADGKRVFAACSDGIVYSWDTKTGVPGPRLDAKAGRCLAIVLSPDGKILVTGHLDTTKKEHRNAIHVWDAATGKPLRTIGADLPILANTLTFTPDSKILAGGCNKHTTDPKEFNGVIEWDLATGKERKRYDAVRITPGAYPITHAIAYTRDGKSMLVGGGEAVPVPNFNNSTSLHGYLWLFDRETGKVKKTLVANRSDYVRMLLLSPDGDRLYVPTNSLPRLVQVAGTGQKVTKIFGELQCWDTGTWELKWVRESSPQGYWALIAAPNGKRIGTATTEGFYLFDALTGDPRGGLVKCGR